MRSAIAKIITFFQISKKYVKKHKKNFKETFLLIQSYYI